MGDLPAGQAKPNTFDEMYEDPHANTPLEDIVKGYKRDPMDICRIGGRLVSFQTAYFVMMKYKIGGTVDAVAKEVGMTYRNGEESLKKAGKDGRNAMMDMLGLSEAHLANVVNDATFAMKKRKVYSGDKLVEVIEEVDHEVRLKAADIAGKWRGMKPKEQIEISGMGHMNHEKVVEIVRKMGQEIIPGQHKMIENGKEKEETKKDS